MKRGRSHAWREDLKKIIDETHRCKRIVADLLNFARQQEMLAQEVDVHEMLEQAIRSVSHQPSFSQVQFVRQFAPRSAGHPGRPGPVHAGVD